MNQEIRLNFERLILKLKKISHSVDQKISSTPSFLNNIHKEHNQIYSKSLSYYFEDEVKNNWKKIKSMTQKKIREGFSISNKEYDDSLNYQISASKKINILFKKYDFIICPSTVSYGLKSIMDEKDDYCLIWTFRLTSNKYSFLCFKRWVSIWITNSFAKI